MAGAINLAVQDSEGNAVSDGNSPAAVDENYTGPRTLDGRPAPQAVPDGTSSSKTSRPQQKKKGVATLASLGGGHAHDSEDDEHDDDEDEDEKTDRGDLFAGGEKSGLAVKDPHQRKGEKKEGSRGIVSDIISKARELVLVLLLSTRNI
jgi:UBX domain-containing protein 1